MKIGFIGAGRMAQGILSAMGGCKGVAVADKNAATADEVAARFGVKVLAGAAQIADACDVLFLAVRPQDVDEAAGLLKGRLGGKHTIVSIVAGKTIKRLKSAFGAKPSYIRVMPNLALRAGAGMCAVCPSAKTPAGVLRRVMDILSGAGEAVVLKEKDFDAVTALSGSGPAYFAYMEEAMVEGGVKLGLKRAVARLLAEQTMYGTAKFLRESGMDLRKFIDGVCTKGGTTAAGMSRLDVPSFKKTVADTLAAAAARSRELA